MRPHSLQNDKRQYSESMVGYKYFIWIRCEYIELFDWYLQAISILFVVCIILLHWQ